MDMMMCNDAPITINDMVNMTQNLYQISTLDGLILAYQHMVEDKTHHDVLVTLPDDTIQVLFAMCLGNDITAGFVSEYHEHLRCLNKYLCYFVKYDVYVNIQLFGTKQCFISHIPYDVNMVLSDNHYDTQTLSDIKNILQCFVDKPAIILDDFVDQFDTLAGDMFEDTECYAVYSTAVAKRLQLLQHNIRHISQYYADGVTTMIETGFSQMTPQATVVTIRKKMGLSQKRFAERFGIPLGTLAHWEQGVRKPPSYVVSMLYEICCLEQQYGKS